jgi:inosine-uridine nucleoside N-ribohydrolase
MIERCAGLCLAMVLGVSAVSLAGAPARPPVPVIFDTDIGNDIDDTLALALLHALESRGECKLLAVTVTKDNEFAAPMVDIVNTFYGRGSIPIGVVRRGVTPDDGNYVRKIATATDDGQPRYPHKLLSGRDAPEATALLRKVLAAQPDASVVIVQVGFSTNLARLLESRPDDLSPLDGMALVKAKVKLLSAMAGSFDGSRLKEYNVVTDLKPAQKVFAQWPTPIVFSGFEVGRVIKYPARSIEQDYNYVAHHPVAEAYKLYMKMPYDRETWDLTSALYAVRPEGGFFGMSEPGRVVVKDDGVTEFRAEANGPHRYLKVNAEQIARVKDELVKLCSQKPDTR